MEAIKMVDITEIMDMLDWHMPSEIQSKGISLARNTETIIPFIQPLTPKHLREIEKLEHLISTFQKFDVMFFCGLIVLYNPFLRKSHAL